MKWTKEVPTVDGWYWWRTVGMEPEICLVFDDGEHSLFIKPHVGLLTNAIQGEWAGPIPKPKEEDDG